jgi:hypothetical protein
MYSDNMAIIKIFHYHYERISDIEFHQHLINDLRHAHAHMHTHTYTYTPLGRLRNRWVGNIKTDK